ncbi:acetyl-CoA acetyltransferase [Amycolatopsis jejuensis]|uniref:acetyl-CoA acetyltransferase n=1 Tax=Amycolatopsis jejuensis TaxID=330084 RepID=UPI000525F028|nr:acetyl-CoA acetyltransferase [Amycolatopsis jejuensis]
MSTSARRDEICIAGVAEAPLGIVTDHSELSMAALASRAALDEAGLSFRDVDGLFTNYMGDEGTVQLGEYLGICPDYADSSDLGGAAFDAYVHHAMLALAAGHCSVALIAFASRQRSKRIRSRDAGAPGSLMAQFEAPYGIPAPLGQFALFAARHMHEFGTTREQLAEIAVAARGWAALNPQAWRREPLTVDDVLNSPPVCEPLTKLDCCLLLDGGGAVVLTTRDRARDAARTPIRVLAATEHHTAWHISQHASLTETPGVRTGRAAFAMAGIVPGDVDVFEPYDATTINVLMALEDLGFCAKGEGGEFVRDGRLAPGGALPSMTSGGGLSYNHPGAFGVQLLIEATRQLRGDAAARQVPGAQVGVVHGIGGLGSVAATVVLARD